jgi:hypothetical protein
MPLPQLTETRDSSHNQVFYYDRDRDRRVTRLSLTTNQSLHRVPMLSADQALGEGILSNGPLKSSLSTSRWLQMFEDPALQRNVSDLLRGQGAPLLGGYLEGRVLVAWKIDKKARFTLRLTDGSVLEMNCVGKCLNYLKSHQVRFTSHDVIKVAVDGAQIEDSEASSEHCNMKVIFKDRLVLQFVKRIREPQDNGRIITIWRSGMSLLDLEAAHLYPVQTANSNLSPEEDWFLTPHHAGLAGTEMILSYKYSLKVKNQRQLQRPSLTLKLALPVHVFLSMIANANTSFRGT